MHKIDTDTAVGNEFVDGDKAASIKATRLNAKWFNTIQRELCNLLTKFGVALSETNDQQIYDLLKNPIGGNFDSLKATTITVEKEGSNGVVTLDLSGFSYEAQSGDDTLGARIYAGNYQLRENGQVVTLLQKRNLLLDQGAAISYNGREFVFSRNCILHQGDSKVELFCNESGSLIEASEGSGSSRKVTSIRPGGIVTSGGISADGVSLSMGDVNTRKVTADDTVLFNKDVQFAKPSGGSFQMVAANDYLQVGGRLHAMGDISTDGLHSIGNGSTAFKPKNYDAGSNSSISVTLRDRDFCFVHKNKPSSGVANTIAITETGSSASTTFTGSSNEMCVIVYRFGNKIFANALY